MVPEMNRGQVVEEVKKSCVGEVIALGQANGDIIHPEKIEDLLRRTCS